MEIQGVRLTVGIEGSFGILHYAVLAFTAARPTADRQLNVEQWPLLTQELLERGFRPARNADVEDIVLKAQPADGSIQCRASTEGLVSLLVWCGQGKSTPRTWRPPAGSKLREPGE